ncbi:MAG: DUF5662 family protein [Lachnospiraceae bacterium]|nr:DUF5662 family protein [Lachnospiraceae bacterium]
MYHLIKHFETVVHHKILVAKGCFAVGLYWQGLVHDMSKFSPTEFLVSAKYFQGNQSPNNAERDDKGYSSSWLHHKGRNKHHYEYWIDYSSQNKGGITAPVEMPLKYVVEMLMDRIAASKVYNKENYKPDMPLKYFTRSMKTIPMHPNTKRLLYALLRMLAVYGEETTFRYVKYRLLPTKGEILKK